MKLVYASAAWLGIGAILGWSLLAAVKGSPVYLAVALLAFIIAVGKIGCSVSDH